MTDSAPAGTPTVLVVDMANVVGSVPDGWWRDRVGAAQRLLTSLAALSGRTVPGPVGQLVRIVRIVAVLEGKANRAIMDDGRQSESPEIVRATGSGDDAIVALARTAAAAAAAGESVLVVSADRGLRARLPAAVGTAGPGWLNGLLGRSQTKRERP